MARMCCACGHVISGLIGYAPEEFTILPKRLLHEISLEDKNKKINFDSFADKIYIDRAIDYGKKLNIELRVTVDK